MKLNAKYKITIARMVLRGFLDELTIYDLADMLVDYPQLLKNAEKNISDYISRNLDSIDVKNILSDEIGAVEYHKRYAEIEKKLEQKKLKQKKENLNEDYRTSGAKVSTDELCQKR